MKMQLNHEKILGIETWLVKLLILPTAVGVMFLISVSTVLMPKINEVNDYRLKIAKNKSSAKEVRTKTQYLISIDQESVKTNVEQLSMALLRNKDAYFLVNVIRDVCQNFDFRVESFAISPGEFKENTGAADGKTETKKAETAKTGLERVPVDLMLIGPEQKYVELISAMERVLPILTLDKVAINVKQEVAELKLTVSTNFNPEPSDYKIKALSLADLILKDEEMTLIDELKDYKKIAGVSADENGLIKVGDFVRYERQDPFGL